MSTTKEKLEEIARQVLEMNENELMELLPGYQSRMENYSTIREWEESVVLYFLINGFRIKNIQFCERLNQLYTRKKSDKKPNPAASARKAAKPKLTLVR
ncbi:MAG: hypothetical protein LBR80_17815 [Deltaproteobacteria bacterium]|jgi:hypothetical protein|nr:hypothetical protein [Deltaproteobacteria bacterium]